MKLSMKPPKFWCKKNSPLPYLLLPLSLLYNLGYLIRCLLNRKPYRSKIPIICVGNINVGGSGKTPTTIEIAKILKQHGKKFCFLTRGYGGNFSGILKVDSKSKATQVGDEALLLREFGDVYVAKSRLEGLKYINNLSPSTGSINTDGEKGYADQPNCSGHSSHSGHNTNNYSSCNNRNGNDGDNFLGYDYILMDDGLQNPTFHKDKNILVLDALQGLGNGHLLPAGNLRESFRSAASRVDMVILLGENCSSLVQLCDSYGLKHIQGQIVPRGIEGILKTTEEKPSDVDVDDSVKDNDIGNISNGVNGGKINDKINEANNGVDNGVSKNCPALPWPTNIPYLAFCGIGNPRKFLKTLEEFGIKPCKFIIFEDHHSYSREDIKSLLGYGLKLITTKKDWVKFPPTLGEEIKFLDIELNMDKKTLEEVLGL